MTSEVKNHLYATVDDILMSYQGVSNPLAGVFVSEDIAFTLSQTIPEIPFSLALQATVRTIQSYGLVLSYSDTCDMVDDILRYIRLHIPEGTLTSWLRTRKSARSITAILS